MIFLHHCHWFCLLYTKDHKNSNKVKALSWETGYEFIRVISWRDLLSKIAKMADRSFANRVVLLVTAAIYRNGEEKQGSPLVFWNGKLGAKVTRCCLSLFFELDKDFESQIGVASYTCQQKHSSTHPSGVKEGFIKGEALRLLRTNSSQITFELCQKF